MQPIHAPLRTNAPLSPLLHYFNALLNIVPSAVYFVLLIVFCHFDLSQKAILWIFVRVIIGFVHGIFLFFFIRYYFVWKRTKKHRSSLTTLLSILYIFVLAIEFSWMIVGSVFSSRYISEVHLKNFTIFSRTYLILCWLELAFLPGLFLAFLIVQLRRYRRQRRYLGERDQPRHEVDPEAAFKTGGCCSCCVEEDEDRCCCCRCTCCEPEGIMASYILGDEMEGTEMTQEMPEEKERGCCCCGKSKEDGIIVPQTEPVPLEQMQSVQRPSPVTQSDPPVALPLHSVLQPLQPVSQSAQTIPHSSALPQLASQQPPTNQHPISIVPATLQPEQSTSRLQQQSQQQHPTPTSLPVTQIPGIQTLHNVRLIEAIAEDGSGKKVYIAVPNVQ